MNKYLVRTFVVIFAILVCAFTTKKDNHKFSQYRFYNNTSKLSTTDPNDFVFDNRAGASCSNNPDKICSYMWDQSTPPSVGTHPASNATRATSSGVQGQYVAGL